MIKLGQKVRDAGFSGIADSRTEWLNGCVRIGVQPPCRGKDQYIPEVKSFDEEQLEVVDETPIVLPNHKSKPGQTGGARPDPPKASSQRTVTRRETR